MSTSPARPTADRCPGLLRPHVAEDGALVRLRVPGGVVRTDVLTRLADLAGRFGAPVLQLTSRGNLQLRGLPDPLPEAFVAAVEATGLLPSASHERVRNILASPMAPGLQPLVRALDRALCADPALAALPGRFLFAVADAAGSPLSEPYDVAYQQLSPRGGLLLAGGRGRPVAPEDAVDAVLEVAQAFLAHAPEGVWNVRDLPDGSPVLDGLFACSPSVAPPVRPGPAGADLVAGVPLGMLTPGHVAALAAEARFVVVTPWRSVVVPDGPAAAGRLAAAGLVVSPESAAARVSACVGAPHCAKGRSGTLAVATETVRRADAAGRTLPAPVHVVGCERRCGAREGDVVALAPADADAVLSLLPGDPA
ncbi:cobalamin biosynthesis protein CobG [Phycicoccus sp. CSK15P-2]|uniref:cobalamin biosynthesis protein CobG n=1 Tax=Phycicoccus sp. CSK15P-2 TaxID=2807627 RepID=UPI0019501D44|nr:cobalamin biosynthesis protein CobG [Phycicoccus sp. CSK15P-2]MBM6404205.1 cobalamin biosynthesis protein CobG [Phycicoccus sp. CSK15P-2]